MLRPGTTALAIACAGAFLALPAAALRAQLPARGNVCRRGAFRTCNSIQITAQQLEVVPFQTVVFTRRNVTGFAPPVQPDTTAAGASGEIGTGQRETVADPLRIAGYLVVRPRPYDLKSLLLGRGAGRRR